MFTADQSERDTNSNATISSDDAAVFLHGEIKRALGSKGYHGLGGVELSIHQGINHIERLATVGEKAWTHGMATFCRPFTTARIQYFDRSQEEEAMSWIHSVIATTA